MKRRSLISLIALSTTGLGVCILVGCRGTESDELSGSEVAVSAVSGALNNTESQAALGLNPLPRERKSATAWLWENANPVRSAWAATWACSGGELNPSPYVGPAGDPYTYKPVSCAVTLRNGKSASVVWSSAFILNYGASCDSSSPFMDNQAANCTLTRTTAAEGNTRTFTGLKGNSRAITHNTFGAGTGWDTTVSPAPSDDGVILACGASGCAASRTLAISGSHLIGEADSLLRWDHTVSTGVGGVTVTGAGVGRVVTGAVIVQHNLAHRTSTTVFNEVAYGDATCCYPTGGSVSTTFTAGSNRGKTETLSFTATCGEASLTKPDGSLESLTLEECL